MNKSRKEIRRLAMLREAERRAREIESNFIASASSIKWGSAKLLSETVCDHIIRLGGLPLKPVSNSSLEILSKEISWPTGKFNSSAVRYSIQNSLTLDASTETEFQDNHPLWCKDFEFAFKDNSQGDFDSIDRTKYVLIGSDSHFLYFIHDNLEKSGNPLVSKLDHETIGEQPFQPDGATFQALLEPLIAT